MIVGDIRFAAFGPHVLIIAHGDSLILAGPELAAPMSARDLLRQRLTAGLAELELDLSAATVERLLDYVDLLARWNNAYNLTAVRDPLEMVTRHLLDSLAVAPWASGDRLVDIGSGAGLPGIPLALIAADTGEPNRQFVLVDSNGKKARFLRAAVRELELKHVEVAESRVESVSGQFDCVTSRAFATLADMLGWGGHLLAPNGIWLALKGRVDQAEIDAIPIAFQVRSVQSLRVPGLEAERHAVIISHQGTPSEPMQGAESTARITEQS